MNPRLVEELARQRHAEVLAKASRPRPADPHKHQRPSMRSNAGWAIVAIGLRIAGSGNSHTSVATANHWC
jgi:hypothetical protein